MDRVKAIELLKQKSKEAVYIASLPYANNEYLPWRRNIEDVLESAFGITSTEYKRVANVLVETNRSSSQAIQAAYKVLIHKIQQEVDSTIQKYEILETETNTIELINPNNKEIQNKQLSRKNLRGTPEEIAPHIIRVAESFEIQGVKYKATYEMDGNKFSTQLRIWCGTEVDHLLVSIDGPYPDRHDIGIITLQSLPDDKTLFIAKNTPSDSYNSYYYFNSLLKELSLELKNLNIEEVAAIEKITDIRNEATDIPTYLFDNLRFHPKVIEASKSCFVAGNYREAILNSFISLIDYVKEITGLDIDGDSLMTEVFSFRYDKEQKKFTKLPLVRINKLSNQTERDEQQGFMYLCKGAVAGIRNPKAHKIVAQSNPLFTLEYLAFASLLMRRIEESKVVKPRKSKINQEIFITCCKENNRKKSEELFQKAKKLKESRSTYGDFINWGVAGYSYNVPWAGCPNGDTIFIDLGDGNISLWLSIIDRAGEAGRRYQHNLIKIPSFASKVSDYKRHKQPYFAINNIPSTDIDAFISAVKELGEALALVTETELSPGKES